jgi:DNA recombination protein RmuC
MDTPTLIILIVLFLNLAALAWLLLRSRRKEPAGAELAILEEKLRGESARLDEFKKERAEKDQRLESMEEDLSAAQRTKAELQARMEERDAQVEKLRGELDEKNQALDVTAKERNQTKLELRDTKTRLEEERKQNTEKLALLAEAKEQMKEERGVQVDKLQTDLAAKNQALDETAQERNQTKLELQDTKTRLEEERKQNTEKLALLAEAKEQMKEERDAQVDKLQTDLVAKNQALDETTQERNQTKLELRDIKTRLEEERKQSTEKLALLAEAKEQMKVDFKNLAQGILDENAKKFTVKNKESMDTLLSPLKEQIGNFRKKIEDVHEKDTVRYGEMMGELTRLKELNQQINQDAINLTNALKGDNKTQGNWGELVLERILEESGLQEGREFHREVSVTLEDGTRRRPDVVIQLPEKKDVIIDSKVSLTAYEQYCSSESEEGREKALKAHIQSLRNHIKGLSEKNYEDLPGFRTLGYVLLFIPIEPAFLIAVQEDKKLFFDAFEKNIMVVSPTTLLVTLRTIESIWRNEHQNKNAQDIANKAGLLYDKFVGFVESLQDVGKQLDRAKKSYDKAENQLHTGSGNLVRKAQDLQALGVKTKKELPQNMVESAEDNLLLLENHLQQKD